MNATKLQTSGPISVFAFSHGLLLPVGVAGSGFFFFN